MTYTDGYPHHPPIPHRSGGVAAAAVPPPSSGYPVRYESSAYDYGPASEAQATSFRKACQRGDAAHVQAAVRQGLELDHPQEDGCTGLWLAAEAGAASVVDLLCAAGADVNVRKTAGGVSCLYVAAQNGHAGIVSSLLASGAQPALPKESGATPLFIAAQQGSTAVVEALLRGGAGPSDATRAGVTPLMIAAFQGHADVVRLLVARGADPGARGSGKTAAEWAESNGTLGAVRDALLSAAAHHHHHHHHHHRPPSPGPPVPPARPQRRSEQPPLPQRGPSRSPSPAARRGARRGGAANAATPAFTDEPSAVFSDDAAGGAGAGESPFRPGPSHAYEEAQHSLASLFKIKDQPIDLDRHVRRELQDRREASVSGGGGARSRSRSRTPQRAGGRLRSASPAASSRAGGSVARTRRPAGARAGSRGGGGGGRQQQRRREPTPPPEGFTEEPTFMRAERLRAQEFKEARRGDAAEKKAIRPEGFFDGHRVGGGGGIDKLWQDYKYSLSVQEGEMIDTRNEVQDAWMFTAEERRRRAQRHQAEEGAEQAAFYRDVLQKHAHNNSSVRAQAEASPARNRREEDEARRVRLHPSSVQLDPDMERVARVAAVMKAADPAAVQRHAAELAARASTGTAAPPLHPTDADITKQLNMSAVSHEDHAAAVSAPPAAAPPSATLPPPPPPPPPPQPASLPPSAVPSRRSSVVSSVGMPPPSAGGGGGDTGSLRSIASGSLVDVGEYVRGGGGVLFWLGFFFWLLPPSLRICFVRAPRQKTTINHSDILDRVAARRSSRGSRSSTIL